jgi:hypothetical protein
MVKWSIFGKDMDGTCTDSENTKHVIIKKKKTL